MQAFKLSMDTRISMLTHGSRPGHTAPHGQTQPISLARGPCPKSLLCAQALKQSTGVQRQQYESWRRTLLQCLANVEAVIDFGEDEGIAEEVAEQVLPRVQHLGQQLEQHLESGELSLNLSLLFSFASSFVTSHTGSSQLICLVKSLVSVLLRVLGLKVGVKVCPHT